MKESDFKKINKKGKKETKKNKEEKQKKRGWSPFHISLLVHAVAMTTEVRRGSWMERQKLGDGKEEIVVDKHSPLGRK